MTGKKIIWEPWMLDYLRDHYAVELNTDIAEKFGISVRSVRYKALELGLDKDMSTINRKRVKLSADSRRGMSYPCHFQPGMHPKTEFKPGRKESKETLEKRRAAISRGMRKLVYTELVRMKYGFPRETRLRLNKKTYIDKSKYLEEDDQ